MHARLLTVTAWALAATMATADSSMAKLAAFEEAKARWYSRSKVQCQTKNMMKGMVPSPFAFPEPEKCEGKLVRFGGRGDGGWNVCFDSTLRADGAKRRSALNRARRCAAYLVGAGSDITFDMEFANATRCSVFTIDPTPGLAQRLSTNRGIASLVAKSRQHLRAHILASGPPPNWRHVNVGLAASDTTVKWEQKGGWAGSHARFLNVTSVDPTVHLRSIPSLMSMLGHTSVQLVKMDAEGAEWAVLEQLMRQTKLAQLMLELHQINPQRAFAFYELMMRHGLLLMGQDSVRYVNGNRQIDMWFVENQKKLTRLGLPKRAPFTFRHVRYTNGTMCGNALGEFHFYRPASAAIAPASWRYTSTEYQYANE